MIEDGISVIGEYAFYNDTSVQVISVPNSVNAIGQYAFYNCNSIKEINIPNGVTAIRSHAFFGCASLENIVTPNSVTLIEDYAFYGCVEAKNLTISNNCKSIGDNAFYNCKSITTLTIPSSVTKIGSYAFRSCILITELDFSDNVEDIGECAFYDCNALQVVRLGKRVTELKDRMFYGCVNLTDLYVNAPLSFIDELAFYGADDVTIHCGRDDYMLAFFEDNGLNYEIDESLIYEYKVVFKDADGNILSSALYKYGETVIPPETPKRPADNTYTYTFKSWDKPVVTVGGNAEYIAVFDAQYIEYRVIFKDYDGTVISSETYHYGDAVAEPSAPTRAADKTYTYAFRSWDKEIGSVTGDVTYTAIYDATYIEYRVIFKDYDGAVISSETYHYGDAVAEPSAPTKPADKTYTYAFKSWDKEITSVSENVTYIATYEATYIEYKVIFKNYDGTILSSKTYHYGDTVTEPDTPTKPSDNTYTYEFACWNRAITTCAGDAEYTALYRPVYIEYTVVFKNYDGTVLSSKTYHYGDTITMPETPVKPSDNTYYYTFNGWNKTVVICGGDAEYEATYLPHYREYSVIFKNYDGTVLSRCNYHYDDVIAVPEDPTQEADLIGTFVFAGWDKEITKCHGDTVYTATYDIAYIDYTVIFKNYDGTVLSSATYHYGDIVSEPSTPTKPADNTYTYTFKAWDKAVTSVTGNTIYTATYAATYIEYTVIFKNYDGTVLSSKTYHYGDTVTEPDIPTKPSDHTFSYVFTSWDKEIVAVSDSTEYIAQYDSVYIEYTVIFEDYDGTVLSSEHYHYGDSVTEPRRPLRLADKTYIYAFRSWDKEIGSVSENITYTATYDATYIEYTVVFKNDDGSVLSSRTYHYGDTVFVPTAPLKSADNTYTYEFNGWGKAVTTVTEDTEYVAQFSAVFIDYTVVFKNYDGTVLASVIYHYGDAVVEPKKPTKPSDNIYSYVFGGWNKTVTACVGNAEYTAMFNAEYIEYTVIFKDYDGEVIDSKAYHYGDRITIPESPARGFDASYHYRFSEWSQEVTACDGNRTYTAVYQAIPHQFGIWVETKAPTCTEKGTERRMCTDCNASETREKDSLGHNFAAEFTIDRSANCVDPGSKSRHCTRCDAVTEVTEIAARGHQFGIWVEIKAPTCTEKGTERHTCTDCNASETREKDSLGHNFAAEFTIDRSANCVDPGSKSRHCTRCDAVTEVTEIAALGHQYDEGQITIPATAATEGTKTYMCVRCEETKTEQIAKLAPKIIEETHTVWNNKAEETMIFRSDAAISDFTEVRVNGKILSRGNYSVREGSIIVELKPEYLNTLEKGEYKIEIVSASGIATSAFTIEEANGGAPILWILLGVFAVLAVGACVAYFLIRKKKGNGSNA